MDKPIVIKKDEGLRGFRKGRWIPTVIDGTETI